MTLRTITRWYGNACNARVSRRLRSDDHARSSGNHLLLTLKGRKSATLRTFPVNYRQTPEGTLIISTEANWWHNFIGGTDVDLLVAGKPVTGHGVIITDDAEKRDRFGRMLAGFSWRWFAKSLKIIEITPQA